MEEARQVKVYVDVNQVMMYLRIVGKTRYSTDAVKYQLSTLRALPVSNPVMSPNMFDLAYDLTGMIEKFGGIA
jgi:hypothetical protein